MIDHISAILPLSHSGLICGGFLTSSDAAGEVEWKASKRLSVEGSHSSKIQVKSCDLEGQSVYVTGNPVKFLQGHNLFGTDDVLGLMKVFYARLVEALGLTPTDFDWYKIEHGIYELTRVDINYMLPMEKPSDVSAILRALGTMAKGKQQAVSAYKDESVYMGLHSRRTTLRMYNKLLELAKHPLPKEIPYREELTEYASAKLRVEVVLRSMELKQRGLRVAANWASVDAPALVAERIKQMKMPEKMKLTKSTIKGLPGRLQLAYEAWLDGKDVRAMVSRATFFRYRNELLKHGIDISIPQPVKPESNVVPMFRYIVANFEGNVIPDFAKGTPLYADPANYRRKAA